MPNSPRLDNALIRLSARVAQRHDIKLDHLLRECQLNPDNLYNPTYTVHLAQEQRFNELLVSNLPILGLGLRIGQEVDHVQAGPFGLLLMTAKNLQDAANHAHLLCSVWSPNVTYSQFVSPEASCNYITTHGVPSSLRIFLIERMLSSTFCQANKLMGGNHYPLRLELDFPDPGYCQYYEDLFQCPVLFDQPTNRILYPTEKRHLTFSSHDERTNSAISTLCQELKIDLQGGNSFKEQVQHQLLKYPLNRVNLDDIARHLGQSPRSLRRHLAAENTAFQAILNKHKLTIAKDKLRNTQTPVTQIAQLCGFAEYRSFIRAFKKWTGLKPSEYRISKMHKNVQQNRS